jgi:hypothetical protein
MTREEVSSDIPSGSLLACLSVEPAMSDFVHDNTPVPDINTILSDIRSAVRAREFNVLHHGLKGDGVTDGSHALQVLASTLNSSSGGEIFFSPGTYRIAASLTLPDTVGLHFAPGARLSIDPGATVAIRGPLRAGLHHVFEGDGTADLHDAKVEKVVPQWWGAKADERFDDHGAFSKGPGRK